MDAIKRVYLCSTLCVLGAGSQLCAMPVSDEPVDPVVDHHEVDLSEIPDGYSWGGDAEIGSDSGFSSEDIIRLFDPWVYVRISNRGTYSLQEINEPGSTGWVVFNEFGLPLESYEPLNLHLTSPSEYNGGVLLLFAHDECDGDLNNDGLIDIGDARTFTQGYLDLDPIADLNDDGVIDLRDQLMFIDALDGGCL